MITIQRTYFVPDGDNAERLVGVAVTTEEAEAFERMNWTVAGTDEVLYVAGAKRALAKGITRCRSGVIRFSDFDGVACEDVSAQFDG